LGTEVVGIVAKVINPTDTPERMATATVTQAPAAEVLHLRGKGLPSKPALPNNEHVDPDAKYKYKRFLPHFDSTLKLPPLTEFKTKIPDLRRSSSITPGSSWPALPVRLRD
jgi:hypothetical protein